MALAGTGMGDAMLFVGLFCLGALSGLLLAWSSTPVVSVMAPLLFGLAAAGTTIVIGRADPESRITRARLRLVGRALTGLCCGCILTLVSGVYIKHRVNSDEAIDLTQRKDIRQAIILRAKLQALGASQKEITAVLSSPHLFNDKALDDAIKVINGGRETASQPPTKGLFPSIAGQPPATGRLAPFRHLYEGFNTGSQSEKRG